MVRGNVLVSEGRFGYRTFRVVNSDAMSSFHISDKEVIRVRYFFSFFVFNIKEIREGFFCRVPFIF
jgi:hypothetical protein